MKILKYLLLFVLVIVVGGAVYLASLDGKYEVSRSCTINAPLSMTFNTVNEFKTWGEWGPWKEKDSSIVYYFPAITSGENGSYTWTGTDPKKGMIRNVSVSQNKEILQKIKMDDYEESDIYWNFEAVENGTKITWGIKGEMPFLVRWMAESMDEKIGPMYDRGFELLEEYLQGKMNEHSVVYSGEVDYGGGFYVYLSTSCTFDQVPQKMEEMMPKIHKYVKENGIITSGYPFTVYHKWDEDNHTTMFSVGIPVRERVKTNGTVLVGFQKRVKTAKFTSKGAYKYGGDAWMFGFKTLEEKGLKIPEGAEPFEVYLTSPMTTENPADYVTEIYLPVE
ncbi:MAG: AraC family transcriptional regulator [Flavobacteriaceae bacterium]|nr:MAG: AraC family transcriptional regulator [Flavobacteriaceae bacterium]